MIFACVFLVVPIYFFFFVNVEKIGTNVMDESYFVSKNVCMLILHTNLCMCMVSECDVLF